MINEEALDGQGADGIYCLPADPWWAWKFVSEILQDLIKPAPW